MTIPRAVAMTATAGGVAALAVRLLRQRRTSRRDSWYAVTLAVDPADLNGPDRPDELTALSEHHEIRITPAPGGNGTELAVRAADGRTREHVRALKQLLETGEVLRVEGQPEGHRTLRGRTTMPIARQLMRRGAR